MPLDTSKQLWAERRPSVSHIVLLHNSNKDASVDRPWIRPGRFLLIMCLRQAAVFLSFFPADFSGSAPTCTDYIVNFHEHVICVEVFRNLCAGHEGCNLKCLQRTINPGGTTAKTFGTTNRKTRSEQPLVYWRTHKSRFPARAYLSAPCTSVDNERLFSAASHVLDEKRNRLTCDKAEMLLFIKKNLHALLKAKSKCQFCIGWLFLFYLKNDIDLIWFKKHLL